MTGINRWLWGADYALLIPAMNKWLALAAGSLAGGFARYWLAGAVHGRAGAEFPYGTMAVNLSGCFLIGLFDALTQKRFLLGPETRVLLMTGFCGAYTTFSTLILETANLMKDGEMGRGLANAGVSLLAGYVLFRCGAVAGEIL